MTDSTGTPSTPAGWYADPAGSDRLRWWDGTRWTDHLADAPAAAAGAGAGAGAASAGAAGASAAVPAGHSGSAEQAAPAASAPSYGEATSQPYAQQPYAQAAYAAPTPPPQVPASTSPSTWAIWVLAALPAVSLLIALSVDYRGLMDTSPRGLSAEAAITSALLNFVQFLMWGATVVLAFLDWRDLTRRGIAKPFHWAWAFIPVAGGVYLIGRSIVVRRRIEGAPAAALTPMWVWIALNVVTSVIAIAKSFEAFVGVMRQYSPSGY